MASDQKKFFVTTPIYYVNARPHIGHAYTTIVADVLARRHRLLGEDTLFLTGTDEHGQKIERSAAAAGVPPQQFTDRISGEFRTLWQRMGLLDDAFSENDPLFQRRFIRTTDPAHKRGAQKLFRELYNRGAIYLSSYTGQYSIGEEMFVEGPPGTLGPDGRPTETVTEENFFFRLSGFQEELIELMEMRPDGSTPPLVITPESARNEVLSFLRGGLGAYYPEMKRELGVNPEDDLDAVGIFSLATERGLLKQTKYKSHYRPGALKDLSVSRSSFTWGIPVPEDIQRDANVTGNHIIYVWLDALANYMTAIGYGDPSPEAQAEFAKYWPADLHLVGKEITRFHCVYWPAFLLAAGLPLPKQITANGWLLFDNAKMSKSRGNIVRTETILDAFGDHVYGKQFPDSSKAERDLFAADVLRYFLLREIPFGQDGSFSFDALVTRYNADLANGYGNLVSRTLNLIAKTSDGVVEDCPEAHSLVFYQAPRPETPSQLEKSEILSASEGQLLGWAITEAVEAYERHLARNAPSEALAAVSRAVTAVDGFMTSRKPWAATGTDFSQGGRRSTLYTAAESIRIITALLYPILPYATAKVWAQLGLGDIEQAASSGQLNNLQWGGLKPGTKLGPLAPIFPRADKGLAQIMIDMEEARNLLLQSATNVPMVAEAGLPATKAEPASTDPAAPPRTAQADPVAATSATLPVAGSTAETTGQSPTEPTSALLAPVPQTTPAVPAGRAPSAAPADSEPEIAIDDFLKIELRVAQILVAERIPKADKLLRLEVDLGPNFNPQKRQILSGIAQWYTPEELVGRRIAVVANLAPRKMRGLESHGMLLAASAGPDDKPVLASFGEDVALGSRVR